MATTIQSQFHQEDCFVPIILQREMNIQEILSEELLKDERKLTSNPVRKLPAKSETNAKH